MFTDEVRGHLDYFLRASYNLKDSTNGFIRGNCPICSGKFTFGVSIERNKAHCFKCEYDKQIWILIIDTNENVENFIDARKLVLSGDTFNFIPKARVEKVEKKPVELPPFYNSIAVGDSIIAQAARNYLKGRGFDIEDLMYKGIGYCSQGDYLGCIVIPYYSEGALVYWKARKYIGSKAFMNPPETMFGVGKTQLIYNIDALGIYSTINLVESETNALTLGDNTISLGGKSISPWQLSCIIRSPAKTFNVLLDPGEMENHDAIKLAITLSKYKRVRNVRWEGTYDVNDLGKTITKRFIKSTPIKTTREFHRDKMQML